MRAIAWLAVLPLALPGVTLAAPPDNIVYLHRPWVHPDVTGEKRDEMIRQGAADARAALASGQFRWYDGRATLIDNSGGITDGVRAEVLRRYGITEQWMTCPLPGFVMEYQQAYNDAVARWLRQRYGPHFWQLIDSEVAVGVKLERQRKRQRFRPDPPPGFFFC